MRRSFPRMGGGLSCVRNFFHPRTFIHASFLPHHRFLRSGRLATHAVAIGGWESVSGWAVGDSVHVGGRRWRQRWFGALLGWKSRNSSLHWGSCARVCTKLVVGVGIGGAAWGWLGSVEDQRWSSFPRGLIL